MTSHGEQALTNKPSGVAFWWLAGLAILATGLVAFAPVYAWWGVLVATFVVFSATFIAFRKLVFGVNRPRPVAHQNKLLMVAFAISSFSVLWMYNFAPPAGWAFMICVALTFVSYMLVAFSTERRSSEA